MTHIQVQDWKKCVTLLVTLLKYTPLTQSILCLIFSTYVSTTQYVNSQKENRITVYYSDMPVTLKQGKGQQTWYELVDLQARL